MRVAGVSPARRPPAQAPARAGADCTSVPQAWHCGQRPCHLRGQVAALRAAEARLGAARRPPRAGSSAAVGRMARTVCVTTATLGRPPTAMTCGLPRCRSRPGVRSAGSSALAAVPSGRRVGSASAPSAPASASSSPCPSSQMGVGCGGRISIVGRSPGPLVGDLDRRCSRSARRRSRRRTSSGWTARRAGRCVKPLTVTRVPEALAEVGQVLRRDGRVAADRRSPRRPAEVTAVRVSSTVERRRWRPRTAAGRPTPSAYALASVGASRAFSTVMSPTTPLAPSIAGDLVRGLRDLTRRRIR